ncbi:MAG TPA: LLM class flavin-dependent oxidoreductase [Candidatus Binatia bacterium]|nr:LLM class flavin-dependent oxidoreductase [Candidatus Binatia bacterium]
MARKLAISLDWQGHFDREKAFERVRIADEVGVDSVWIAEAWGRDCFTLLTQIAERTKRIRLGTGIVNVYSRTPAALAQHFATLDELSGGRMIAGFGTSGINVIEHFHGVKFEPSLTRLREVVEIFKIIMRHEPLKYSGKLFRLERGFTLRFAPVRPDIPVHLATLNPKALQMTAQVGDGWLPVMIPIDKLGGEVAAMHARIKEAGRDLGAFEIHAPGGVTVATGAARAKAEMTLAGTTAFYIGRMGVYYARQLERFGFVDEVAKVKEAWSVGSAAAAAAVPEAMRRRLGTVGEVAECRERLAAEAAAGANIHRVNVIAENASEYGKTLEQLLA